MHSVQVFMKRQCDRTQGEHTIFNSVAFPPPRGAACSVADAATKEKEIGGSLEPRGPLLTHLHTVYMAYAQCLP
jgi:hypothetical protein